MQSKRGSVLIIILIIIFVLIGISLIAIKNFRSSNPNQSICINSTNGTNSSCNSLTGKISKVQFNPECNPNWKPTILDPIEKESDKIPDLYYCLPNCESIKGYQIFTYPCKINSLGLKECNYDQQLRYIKSHPTLGSGYIYCNSWPNDQATTDLEKLKQELNSNPDEAWQTLTNYNCSIPSFSFITTRSYNTSEYYECALKAQISAEEWNIETRDKTILQQNIDKYRQTTNCSQGYLLNKDKLTYDLAYECILDKNSELYKQKTQLIKDGN